MLKFIFWSLLAANAILFAYGQGYLGSVSGAEREPQRMKNQLNADKLTLVASAGAAPAAPAAPAVVAAACFEVGDFSAAEARRFEARLAPLTLGERMQRVSLSGQDASSHIVYIPSLGSKEAAERKAGELKARGVTDYFIISDGSAMKWAISLGVFKSEAAAQTLLAALVKQGVQSARIGARGGAGAKLAYQFRGVDGALRGSVDEIAGSFASSETRACAKADQG